MEVLDTQMHPPDPGSAWSGDGEAREAMDAIDVDAALVTPARSSAQSPAEAAAQVAGFIDRHPLRFAGVANLDGGETDLDSAVASLRQRSGMLAIRTTIRDFATDHLPALQRVARSFPSITLIVGHLGGTARRLLAWDRKAA